MENIHILSAKLDPIIISEEQLAKLLGIGENSSIQKLFLVYAAKTVKYECKMYKKQISGVDFEKN
ncbi:hypothetical protein [Methanocaldococcus sp.]|uniref:hypothetical protein n=1 Tax=Methanocaldococcus sp. TaxID=2152917 RepID=UPI0026140696|nr:hypothetical protein [Methanocaldococcus sp.]MCQ6253850.1 hypothetical protein [Methanocaldococcus sp.]